MSELEVAREHHKAGRLESAEQIYRELLESQTDRPDALHLLGMIALQRGQLEQGIDLIEQAIRLNPASPAYHSNLGEALRLRGRFEEAADAYRRALELRFDNDTLDNLARVLFAQGPVEQAVEVYVKALSLRPADGRARAGLVSLLRTVRPAGPWPELEDQLGACFRVDDIEHQQLAGITANQLKHKYDFSKRVSLAEPESRAFLDALSSDTLLLSLLTQTVNVDYVLERFFTELRRHILLTHQQTPEIREEHVPLIGAIAQQCFNNEYVFNFDTQETRALDSLTSTVRRRLNDENKSSPSGLEARVALLACYVELASLDFAPALSALSIVDWCPTSRTLFQRALIEPLEEAELEKNIESLGSIDDATSRAVRAQYEESPYPRWLHIGRSSDNDLESMLRERFPEFSPPPFLDTDMKILVAGCGTGKEPIGYALMCPGSEILAIDLSRRSLAYATRMAKRFDVTNVRFLQADILNLGALAEQFHVISSVGVLHHMAEPMTGWRTLVDRLVPAGLMHVNLYSEGARRPLTRAQQERERRGLMPIPDDIRRFRTLVLSGEYNGELADFTSTVDFHSMSSCRDLLFHVEEHRFNISQIREALMLLDLELIGFDTRYLHTPRPIGEHASHGGGMNDLATWQHLEELYPRAFLSMYRFWCRKRSDHRESEEARS